MTERDERTFAVAATLADWIAADGARCAIIGAVALAVHGYVRATRDVDLATELDPFTQLRELDERAEKRGWTVELALPDADNPLGGVLTVTGSDFDPVQFVNFYNPLRESRQPASDALDAAVPLAGSSGLKVVTLTDLVLLKLYAGGLKSLADVDEVLAVNADVDIEDLRRRAERLGLADELERVRPR